MFSQACIIPSVCGGWGGGGVCVAKGGMCGKGGVHGKMGGGMCGEGGVWRSGGVCGRGHAWQGPCVAGGHAW